MYLFVQNSPVNQWDFFGLACFNEYHLIYDFTIPIGTRKYFTYGKWNLVDADNLGYNRLVGYIYVCVWKRDRTTVKYRQYKRYYAYLVSTYCDCPPSLSFRVDSGAEEWEKFVSSKLDKESAFLQFNSYININAKHFCRTQGPPRY